MTQEQDFLAALAENPDDDDTRLVFADWLDDHDDPERAEFIRVQCALARLLADDPTRDGLSRREGDLYRAGAARWLGQAGLDLLIGVEFDPTEQEIDRGPRWEGEVDSFAFERGWLHSICFVWMPGPAETWRNWLRAGFAAPGLSLLHTFESWYVEEDENWDPPTGPVEDPLEGVLADRSLPSLRVLKIGGPGNDYITGIPRQTAAALPGFLEGLPRLAELHLNAHGVDYPAVFAPERLPGLRRLRLTTACANDEAVMALAASKLLLQLQSLELAEAEDGRLTREGLDRFLHACPSHLRLQESTLASWTEDIRQVRLGP